MNQRFVFSSLVLELAVVAYWFLPLLILGTSVDVLTQGKLLVFIAQTSLGLTATSIGLIVIGLLHRRGMMPNHRRLIVGLSWLAILGIVFWALSALDVGLIFAEGCDSITVWKCYFVQAGTYIDYDFLPAIAIPIVTLIWVSRTRTPAEL